MKRFLNLIYPAAVMLVFILFTASISPALNNPPEDPPVPPGSIDKITVEPLPVIGSAEKLKDLLIDAQRLGNQVHYGLEKRAAQAESADMAAGAPRDSAMKMKNEASDYSSTNVQVQGVDEADVIKTDGKYIYKVKDRYIDIIKAYPADEMRPVSRISFDDENFTPAEIYIDEKYLAVIGQTYYHVPTPPQPLPRPDEPQQTEPARPLPQDRPQDLPLEKKLIRPDSPVKAEIYPYVPTRNTMKVIVYDITDRADIKKVREAELEGNYISSRKIGSALYLAANKYIDYYHIMEQETEKNPSAAAPPAPSYRDSATKSGFTTIDYSDIRYFPGSPEPNYLLIAGLDLEKPDEEMEISSYLGSGQNIYASTDNMYVAVAKYEYSELRPPETGTTIYRFGLNQGHVEYSGKGEVPGTILNQFSMDEHEGFFRIATTKGEIWRNDEYTSKNNLYTLGQNLKIAGKIEDIAPGERIYSVRFMGDRAYMVTFKKVDPLFVIDLKDPESPEILGALKIPGYSDYLHPYDENHIIGFGKDTIELEQKGPEGKGSGTMAFYQGMKIAVFDVTDVANPVEKYKEIIGDRGTDSELLRNHKALLFSREKNLLAFPVTVMEINGTVQQRRSPQYGEFAFQGAYIYNLDLEDGFRLQGRISHLSDEVLKKAGQGWYDNKFNVERIVYINDILYTISGGMIKANNMKDLSEINSIKIP
ncbi:MAG: hypothetical protein CVU89_12370 [Firmicutes bacterium HGW-Firmicutes-14]|nr:MAG: hypothetical protein CVU89_12370 [Firmicutes bacterium HGW-Firmicutes-14]